MDDLSKLLRQMGAEEGGKENIKGHAERLWKFMDDLAERDPQEYQNFLKKQAEAAGVGVEGKPGTTGAAGTRAPADPRTGASGPPVDPSVELGARFRSPVRASRK